MRYTSIARIITPSAAIAVAFLPTVRAVGVSDEVATEICKHRYGQAAVCVSYCIYYLSSHALDEVSLLMVALTSVLFNSDVLMRAANSSSPTCHTRSASIRTRQQSCLCVRDGRASHLDLVRKMTLDGHTLPLQPGHSRTFGIEQMPTITRRTPTYRRRVKHERKVLQVEPTRCQQCQRQLQARHLVRRHGRLWRLWRKSLHFGRPQPHLDSIKFGGRYIER